MIVIKILNNKGFKEEGTKSPLEISVKFGCNLA